MGRGARGRGWRMPCPPQVGDEKPLPEEKDEVPEVKEKEAGEALPEKKDEAPEIKEEKKMIPEERTVNRIRPEAAKAWRFKPEAGQGATSLARLFSFFRRRM